MAWSHQSFKVVHDFSLGHFLGSAEVTDGYLAALPDPLWALDSFDIQFLCYENQKPATAPTKSNFESDSTGALYIKFANVADTPTVLASGADVVFTESSVGGGYDTVTCTVHKSDLLAKYAGASQCLLYLVVTSKAGTGQRSVGQKLYITDADGDEGGTPTAADMAYTPSDATDWPETVDPTTVAGALDKLSAERSDGRYIKGSDGNWYRLKVVIDAGIPVVQLEAV